MKIEIRDLNKKIGKNQILDNISVTLISGKVYGLSGTNVPRYEQKTLSIT